MKTSVDFCHWMEVRLKVLEVWFRPVLHVDRNWEEFMTRVAKLTQKWAERKQYLKSRVEIAAPYFSLIMNYRMAAVTYYKRN